MNTDSMTHLFDDFKKFQEQFIVEGKKHFFATCQNIFELVPEISVIKLTGYTPYFNDGDPCEFGVMDAAFSNTKNPNNLTPYGELYEEEEGGGSYSKELTDNPICHKFNEMVCNKAFEPIFLALFGDHVTVTITKDGITTEEFEHE